MKGQRFCDECRHWKPSRDTNGVGECRRHAPKSKGSGSDELWPVTKAEHGCGEFVDKNHKPITKELVAWWKAIYSKNG